MFLAEPSELCAENVVLAGTEGRHAATVRRMRPGERVDLTDGVGDVAECVVTGATPGHLDLKVISRRRQPRREPLVVVVQAIPKGPRAELAVELMTEVGVDAIVPWAAARCVPRWEGQRAARAVARWRDIAREAAKQARRVWLPEVAALASTPQVTGVVKEAARAVLLEAGASTRLADVPVPSSGRVVLIAGPEGGIDEAEKALLTAVGAVPARLGASVLRTSTAGAVAAAVVLSGTGRW